MNHETASIESIKSVNTEVDIYLHLIHLNCIPRIRAFGGLLMKTKYPVWLDLNSISITQKKCLEGGLGTANELIIDKGPVQ
jgi:hypothetical protein